MDFLTLKNKIENYKSNYSVKVIGYSHFNREIFAVERVLNPRVSTAILVAGTHAREHITTDLLCKMLDENLFDEISDFNVSFILMANPDGVELSCNGLTSAPKKYRKKLLQINGESCDFSMWKANGIGVDLNNNFDAGFGENKHADEPAPQGYPGKFAESEPETKAIVNYIKNSNAFLVLTYHSKGEEIYFNFFQSNELLNRDSLIAENFSKSTGYAIKNVENSSSGGLKDFCVQKLKIPSLTIEVGNDNLSHPISKEFLPEIFERHKNVAKDCIFAYNVFNKTRGADDVSRKIHEDGN